MWRTPDFNEVLLKKKACLDDVYKAMGSSDLGEVVVTALEVINKTKTVPVFKKEKKSESVSTDLRTRGNQAYLSKKYQEALVLYNKALKYAPNKSKAMKLAYSNRSALFKTVKAYSACICDIDIVCDMDCPPEIYTKLQQRYAEAALGVQSEDSYWLNIPKFANAYFKPQIFEPRNPQIASASKNVGVIMENDLPKIVAVNDVKVGTVLAVEPAFVNHLATENLDIACYNCHKLDYNLLPCEGCCYVLFCDEMCMRDCMEQYHSVECKLMGLIKTLECEDTLRLALKAAIKMKLHSQWKNLIAASKVYGVDRIKNSTISEIYDERHNLSLLTFKDDRHFVHGKMFNTSFILAAFIHYLGQIPGFFPEFIGRQDAMKCMGRIMMYLTLFGTPTLIADAASINDTSKIESHDMHNFGFFSLTGKLRNSCNPNVLTVGLNDKVGLVALQPIKRGTELTVAYLGHWLDKTMCNSARNRNMFTLYSTICNCVICSGQWEHRTSTLTQAQKFCYSKIKSQEAIDYNNLLRIHKNLCRALSVLHDVPYSKEYIHVYKLLRTCLLLLQHVNTENIVFERAPPKHHGCRC